MMRFYENREIKIGKVVIKDFGKLKTTSYDGYSDEFSLRYVDEYHFEMSNRNGIFGAIGSHVRAIAVYESFCQRNGITLEAI